MSINRHFDFLISYYIEEFWKEYIIKSMMVKKIFSVLPLLVFFLSCDEKKELPEDWIAININLENQRISLINKTDSLYFKKWDYKDTIENNSRVRKAVDFERENGIVTKEEKNKIFKLVYTLITDPITPKNICTDYVGSLRLTIEYSEQMSQSSSYSSICEWSTLSPETQELQKLFEQKLKSYSSDE